MPSRTEPAPLRRSARIAARTARAASPPPPPPPSRGTSPKTIDHPETRRGFPLLTSLLLLAAAFGWTVGAYQWTVVPQATEGALVFAMDASVVEVLAAPLSVNFTTAKPILSFVEAPTTLNISEAPTSLKSTEAPLSHNATEAPTSLNITEEPEKRARMDPIVHQEVADGPEESDDETRSGNGGERPATRITIMAAPAGAADGESRTAVRASGRRRGFPLLSSLLAFMGVTGVFNKDMLFLSSLVIGVLVRFIWEEVTVKRPYNRLLREDRTRTEAVALECLRLFDGYMDVSLLRCVVRSLLYPPGNKADYRFYKQVWPEVYRKIQEDESVWKSYNKRLEEAWWKVY